MVRFAKEHPFVAAFVVALVLRLGYILAVRPDPLGFGDSAEYDAMARDLLAGRGLVDHVGFVRPPLYPFFVAMCYALGGVVVLQSAQILLSALTAPLIGMLSRGLSGSSRAGVAASLAAAIYPWPFEWIGQLASETLFMACAVFSLAAVVWAARTRGARPVAGAGLLVGIAVMARVNMLVLVPALALWLWAVTKFRRAVLFGFVVILTLLPFAAYNLAAGNGLVLGSSGGGLNFYIGNNPDAARFYDGSLSDDEWRRLNNASAVGDRALRDAGCVAQTWEACMASLPRSQRDAFWYRAGFAYIRSAPGEWAHLELAKLIHYWRPWVDPRVHSPAIVIVSGVSFTTLLVAAASGLRRLRRESVWFVALVAVACTATAVGWNIQLRYREALLDPVLIAAAGPALAWWWEQRVDKRHERVSPWQPDPLTLSRVRRRT